jgi:hypothetical protein
MTKLCKDCGYAWNDLGQWHCSHPQVIEEYDPVLGVESPLCIAVRRSGPCGIQGALWEADTRPEEEGD